VAVGLVFSNILLALWTIPDGRKVVACRMSTMDALR
jgi:hypothetical protein